METPRFFRTTPMSCSINGGHFNTVSEIQEKISSISLLTNRNYSISIGQSVLTCRKFTISLSKLDIQPRRFLLQSTTARCHLMLLGKLTVTDSTVLIICKSDACTTVPTLHHCYKRWVRILARQVWLMSIQYINSELTQKSTKVYCPFGRNALQFASLLALIMELSCAKEAVRSCNRILVIHCKLFFAPSFC